MSEGEIAKQSNPSPTAATGSTSDTTVISGVESSNPGSSSNASGAETEVSFTKKLKWKIKALNE